MQDFVHEMSPKCVNMAIKASLLGGLVTEIDYWILSNDIIFEWPLMISIKNGYILAKLADVADSTFNIRELPITFWGLPI